MNTETPIDDLGPPLAIGCILIAVGLALPVIAVVWMARTAIWWAIQFVRSRIRAAKNKRYSGSP